MQTNISRMFVGVVAVAVVLALIIDLLTFGPATRALDPTPWLPYILDRQTGVELL